ncbi:Flp pilus assembly protein CpaB [Falsiroseomonas sp. CW058]|uniref:Flp pilus assembly protein CpaB n=1 Tax=Falsiroseomonas sp. CW058 TaxID=3388664 RepID=UPI003D31F809
MLLRLSLILAMLMGAVGLGALGFELLAPRGAPPAEAAAAPPPAPAPPPRVAVLVAARALPAGTLLKDEDLALRQMPPEAVPPEALPDAEAARAESRGALVRRWLEPGAILGAGDILRPRDRGFLSAVLRPGQRAISVGVDVVTGAAGLIWPGDQVDLILTQELAAAEAPLARRVIGETILSDVRVIAVDQQFTQGAGGAEAGPSRIARTVTIEVAPDQAERVAVAVRLGRIALTIRAIEGAGPAGVPSAPPVFGADVSPALGRSGLSEGVRMRVIQGDESQEVTFR